MRIRVTGDAFIDSWIARAFGKIGVHGGDSSSTGIGPSGLNGAIGKYRFYEKVLKVKADVAAILNSFPPCDHLRCGRAAEGYMFG
jgi:hypothetical protein